MTFRDDFRELTGNPPFPWQESLYERFIAHCGATLRVANEHPHNIPASCNLPTGLGKTSVVAIWLIALANHSDRMPRRLVYVVNRRTVVDQTTTEVSNLRERLGNSPRLEELRQRLVDLCALPLNNKDEPLAISTLRGQFADNREWSADPARPAVIVGTVDMIGSRLLFGGYGVGFKSKPLHAGFLGQDVLLVHDEAHLEPAFQKLLIGIQAEQHEGERASALPWAKLRVMELSATTRIADNNEQSEEKPFELTDEEKSPPVVIPDPPNEPEKEPPIHCVWRRLKAPKRLTLAPIENDKEVADKIAELALKQRQDVNGNDTNTAVLIFIRGLEDVAKVSAKLADKKSGVGPEHVQQLTGTMRGLERDALVDRDPVFMRFLPEKSRNPNVTPIPGTVYLVCTSAGEVGIDISADHMVCDLSTFDSVAQRFGRVNRYGKRTDTRIDVVHPKEFGKRDKKTGELKAEKIDICRQRTLELLKKLPSLGENGFDASPMALSNLNAADRRDAFNPEPTMLSATDILFDAWAMTSIRDKMPGRPEVAEYLHGIAYELPQTTIAWRTELDLLASDPDPRKKLQAIFSKHRIRPHETITTNSYRVIKFFGDITKKRGVLRDTRVAILFARQLILTGVGELIANPGPLNADPTLILPASFGYLDDKGMLSADAVPNEPNADEPPLSLDIADHEGYEPTPDVVTRLRVLIERTDGGWKALPLPGGKPLPDSIRPNYSKSTDLINALRKTGLRVRLVQPIAFDDEGEAVKSLVALSPVSQQQQGEEQALGDHVQAVERAAERLADKLNLPDPFRAALLFAAKWHDEGKKADIWQRYIGGKDGQPVLGKSAKWCDPKTLCGYRHEFGSLLRMEYPDQHQTACVLPDDPDVKDLALHLIAAHHGNARPHFSNSFDRDFSTQQSDQIHTDAIRRFARLQRKYGRWGLAYLESLLRAADAAASAGLETDDDTEDSDGGEA